MTVDFHFHHMPEFAMQELAAKNPWGEQVEREGDDVYHVTGALRIRIQPELVDVNLMIDAMNKKSIDVAAVSPTPLLFRSSHPGDQVLRSHQRINDHLAGLKQSYPTRFAPLGIIPMQDPGVAVKELDRCIGELKLSGVAIETNIGGRNLDSPEFRPVFQRCGELGVPVFLHPFSVLGPKRLENWYLTNLIGNPTDTAVAIASLIFGGVLEANPDLKVVCAHGGGSSAMLIGRWVRGWSVRMETKSLPRSPMHYFRRLYFDSLTHSADALRLLIDMVGARQVVLGSDFPYDMGEDQPVQAVLDSAMSPKDKKSILEGTAVGLLNL